MSRNVNVLLAGLFFAGLPMPLYPTRESRRESELFESEEAYQEHLRKLDELEMREMDRRREAETAARHNRDERLRIKAMPKPTLQDPCIADDQNGVHDLFFGDAIGMAHCRACDVWSEAYNLIEKKWTRQERRERERKRTTTLRTSSRST